MRRVDPPTVMLLDGDFDNTLQVAKELARDLGAHVIGVGTSRFSRLFYSRYCDEAAVLPAPGSETYGEELLSLLHERRPDIVLPVGFRSVAAIDSVRSRVPDDVALCLPDSDVLEIAVDKRKTLSHATEHGIPVPADYTDEVAAVTRSDGDARDADGSGVGGLPFPLFLKARRETGDVLSGRVRCPTSLRREYENLQRKAGGQEILVQGDVQGDGRTYGCGLLFIDGSLKLLFSHVELRSIPRHGGSGTRLRVCRDPNLEAMSVRLLQSLDWHGVALVEFRCTDDGYVLMEINPKFWASYALASQCGYRFASTLIAETLDLPATGGPRRPARTGERVFPLRELAYCLRNFDGESLRQAATAMLWPPARPDVNVEDLPAWLLPPVSAMPDGEPTGALIDTVKRVSPEDVLSNRNR